MNAVITKVYSREYTPVTRQSLVIESGCAQTNTGYRQVAFSRTGEIRPVFAATRGGPVHKQCTRQSGKRGDLVLRYAWYPEEWSIFQLVEEEGEETLVLHPLGHEGFIAHRAVIKSLPPVLDKWLSTKGKDKSYLPRDCGWDGVSTISDVRKAERVRTLFQGMSVIQLEQLVREAAISPGRGLQWDWSKAEPLPSAIDNPVSYDLGYHNERHTRTQWVLWDEDGDVEIIEPKPTSGKTVTLGLPDVVHSAPHAPMPPYVVAACRITREAYDMGDKWFGVTWTLFN